MLVAATLVACSLLTNLGDLDRTPDASVGGDGGTPDAAPDGAIVFDASFDALANDVYSIAVVPSFIAIDPGTSGDVTVNATRANGFTSPIVLSLVNPPNGITFNPATIFGASATLSISVAANAIEGREGNIEVRGDCDAGPSNAPLRVRIGHVLESIAADKTFKVPPGVTKLVFKLWGAGGGGGCDLGNSAGTPGSGGAGGFASGTLDVVAGEVLTIVVGTGGGGALGAAGGGGGYTAVARNDGGTMLLVAGGGGGGGGVGSGSILDGANGGAGGGDAGANGSSAASGQGATVTTNGLPGARNPQVYSPGLGGNPLLGGDGWRDLNVGVTGAGKPGGGGGGTSFGGALGGGGGGGGWRGGGGGAGGDANTYAAAAGGGGSGYVAPIVLGPSVLPGVAKVPPMTTDKAYGVGVGVGGNGAPSGGAAAGSSGGPGRVVILYP